MQGIKSTIPSAVTAFRLALVLPLVYLLNNDLHFFGALLFFSLIATDFFDGYLARKLGVSSKFGAYFDATVDFTVILCLFASFIPVGFCADWVLLVIVAVFVEFILTSQSTTKMYDPIGKYYGSLLFGLIAMRFFLSGQLFYDIVTFMTTVSAAASILSRATFIYKEKKRVPRVRGKRVGFELLLTSYAEPHRMVTCNANDR